MKGMKGRNAAVIIGSAGKGEYVMDLWVHRDGVRGLNPKIVAMSGLYGAGGVGAVCDP